MRLRRIIPTSRAGRTVAALATASLVAGVALTAVGLTGAGPESAAPVEAESQPVALARSAGSTDSSGGQKAYVSGVSLADYEPAASRAVLAVNATGDGPEAEIKSGDVIASPPTKKAPHGALFKVGTVTKTDKGVEVTTEPATISDALGDVEVSRVAEAPAIDMTVKPLVAGVQPTTSIPDLPEGGSDSGQVTPPTSTLTPTPTAATPTATPSPSESPIHTPSESPTSSPASSPTSSPTSSPASSPKSSPAGGYEVTPNSADKIALDGLRFEGNTITKPDRMPNGGLLLTLDVPLNGIPGVTGTGAGGPKLAGWVGLTPKLIFSFGKKKEIGLGGKYDYGWQVHAKVDRNFDTGERALQIPFAEVHLRNTFWIGFVPIVVSADLTYFWRITADGVVSIDAEQSTKGEFAVGGKYESGKWVPLNRHEGTTDQNSGVALAGRGDVRAIIGSDLKLFLFDAVGVQGRLAPYLRGIVDVSPPQALWGLYAGFGLKAKLSLQLKIFGVTVLKSDLDIPPLDLEWKIVASDPPPSRTRAFVSG